MKTFNETLRKLLKQRKITQKELGEFLKFSNVAINHYVTGQTEPSLDTLIKLSNYFNVTIDYLITGNEANEDYIMIRKDTYYKLLKKLDDLKKLKEEELENSIKL